MKGHVNFAHIKMHAVLCWIVILCCWQETQAKSKISTLNSRTRVALAEDEIYFNLSLIIPANRSLSLLCYTQNRIVWRKYLKSEFLDNRETVKACIKMDNSSCSGNYVFRHTLREPGDSSEVHWVVHVRDKGYQEPDEELEDDIITMMAFSGILLIFSVAGSLYILKSYKDQPPCRDDKNVVAEQRPEESEDVMLDENAASASLYTALQYRSSSIYDTLDPEIMEHEENTRKKKSDKKHCKAQEEAFDSIYENL